MATRGRRRTSARCRRAAARLCLGRSVPAATATSDAPGDGAPSGFTRTLRWEWGAVRLSGAARDGRREEPRDTKPGTRPALRTEHSQSSKGPQAHTWPRPSELRDRGHSVLTRHLLHRVAVRSRSVTRCKAFEVAAGHSQRSRIPLFSSPPTASPTSLAASAFPRTSQETDSDNLQGPPQLPAFQVHVLTQAYERHIPRSISGVYAGRRHS